MSSYPPRQHLEIEDIGDVTVATFLDKKLLDEQNIQLIGEQMFALVEKLGRQKVLLSMENVEYMSSAALGKFLTLQGKLLRVRGRMAVCAIDSQVMELWEITRWNKYIQVFATRSEALQDLSAGSGDEVLVTCPLRGCVGAARVRTARLGSEVYLRCPECNVLFRAALPGMTGEGEAAAPVSELLMTTYKEQKVQVCLGQPCTLWLPARLDLFASEVLRRLWQALPSPRWAVVDCRQVRELSEQGVAALAELLAEKDGRAVLLVNPVQPPKGASFPPALPVCISAPEAIEALGTLPAEAGNPLTVRIVRPREP